MAVLCDRKRKDIFFSPGFRQSSHNVENEENGTENSEEKKENRKTALCHEKKTKQLVEAQSFCKCAHRC